MPERSYATDCRIFTPEDPVSHFRNVKVTRDSFGGRGGWGLGGEEVEKEGMGGNGEHWFLFLPTRLIIPGWMLSQAIRIQNS